VPTLAIAVAAGFMGPTFYAAANPLDITARVRAETADRSLAFAGSASVNTLTHNGTVTGRTSAGAACTGEISVSLGFSRGTGTLACGALSARYSFTLSQRAPPVGRGRGVLSDGRQVRITIGP